MEAEKPFEITDKDKIKIQNKIGMIGIGGTAALEELKAQNREWAAAIRKQ